MKGVGRRRGRERLKRKRETVRDSENELLGEQLSVMYAFKDVLALWETKPWGGGGHGQNGEQGNLVRGHCRVQVRDGRSWRCSWQDVELGSPVFELGSCHLLGWRRQGKGQIGVGRNQEFCFGRVRVEMPSRPLPGRQGRVDVSRY